jgi:hypothetical protein
VNRTVKLYYQRRSVTIEVDDEAGDHVLPPEMQPCEAICSYRLPQDSFGWRLPASQISGGLFLQHTN